MKLLLIARGNLKKKKSDMTVVFLLVAMAFILLYVGSSVLFNLGAVQDKTNEMMNGADFLFISSSSYDRKIATLMQEQPETEQVFTEDILHVSGCKYTKQGEEQKEKKTEMDFLMASLKWDCELSKMVIVDEGEVRKENSIVLPYYLKVGEGYRTGDIICLTYGERTLSFEVYGFAEDIMFATPANIALYKCFISDAYMEKLQGQPKVTAGKMYLTALKEGESSAQFDDKIYSLLGEKIPDWQQSINFGLNTENMKIGGAMNATILMVVIAIFALLLIVIAIVVIHFSVQNSMEMNLKNIGMLQASGYTGWQLVMVTMGEIMSITIAGLLFGLLLSQKTVMILGNIIASSIGIEWKQGFDPVCASIGLSVIAVLVLVCTFLAALRYKKIAPLDALREGIATHSFRKNSIPLEFSPLPLNMGLGIKSILNDRKKSLTVCLITVMLSFACNMGIAMYQNFVESVDNLIIISGIEVPMAIITMDGKTEASSEEIFRALSEKNETDYIIKRNTGNINISYQDKKTVSLCDFYDYPEMLRYNKVVEGHWPTAANEVLLSTLLCDELGVSLGDIVYLENDGIREAYLLAGICQQISNLGKGSMLTMAGAERLYGKLDANMLYCYEKEGVTYEQMEKAYLTEFPELNIQDAMSNSEVSMKVISDAMEAVCILFFLVTVVVISMIIYLMAKTKLIREKKKIGIYKAIGYTTGQLIFQTVMSYVPIIVVGATVGAVAAYYLINPIIVLCLSAVKFKTCMMSMSIGYMAASATGITLLAGLVAAGCAARIRKVEPAKMIQQNV